MSVSAGIPIAAGWHEPARTYVPAQEQAAAKLQTRELSAYYGDFRAVGNVDLDIPVGAITAIIGPSGCGKSTLLRCFNRMNDLVPGFRSTGSILLDGESITARDTDVIAMRRRVGMLFQRPNPFPASIYDNVAFGLRLGGGVGRGARDGIVEDALRRAGLWSEVEDRLDRSALSLSGGQQQRLCLARALAVFPEVILMDEPCSALDPAATLRIEELMASLRGEVTLVVVTHNMQQAARASDRTVVMMMREDRSGEVVEVGDTRTIFSSPANVRTQDYISGRIG